MNPRLTVALLVVLVALGAGVYFANQSGGAPEPSALGGSTPVPTALLLLGSDKPVERVEILDINKRTAFHKDGDKWVLDEPPGREGDQTRMSAAAAQLGRLRPLRSLPPEGDIASFGLASAQTEVKFSQQGGEQKTLQIGNQNPTQAGYYARLGGEGPIYLLDAGIVTTLRSLASDPPAARPTATPTIVGPVLIPTPVGTGTPAAAITPAGTSAAATPAPTTNP